MIDDTGRDPGCFRIALDESQVGAKLDLVLIRGGRRLESASTAGERPRESLGHEMPWGCALEYLDDGWAKAEIASALKIGVRTVRFHLAGIYAKLGVVRRGEAVREALRKGLVSFDF
jgi:DNA-binding NarL/FixJ family response regulator